MCRWLAYSGAPLALDALLFKPQNSLIHQSRHSTLSDEPFHGDGFGVGWYSGAEQPGIYTCIHPAWNDSNLRNLAPLIESPLFLAHVRAATDTPVQQTNCHPFRHRNWLFQHNGLIHDFVHVRRDLHFAVAPHLYPFIQGNTDSEILFFLALTHGLEEDPQGALERMVGHVEAVSELRGLGPPLQMAVAATDGETLYAVRYASEGEPRSLFHSSEQAVLQEVSPFFRKILDRTVLLVSEPLEDLPGVWEAVPPSTFVEARDGRVEERPFRPQRPPRDLLFPSW